MAIQFTAADHKYKSIDQNENIDWVSVTSLISLFKKPFEKEAQAVKSSKNKKSKWYGLTPEEIISIWDSTNVVALDLGTWYHNQREADLLACDTIGRLGLNLPVFKPQEDSGIKIAPDQNLVDGIYPEHMVYLKSVGVCGQADRVEVLQGHINIYDYKTNKEIKTESYKNWEGISAKMNSPIDHLDDCNYIHYAIQLSVYLYIMIKHNPNLKPGKIILEHIQFKKAGEDKYGNPVYEKDSDGNPVVEKVVPYELPYLKKEVIAMIKYLQNNPHLKTKKK
jgi:hypothetical protein